MRKAEKERSREVVWRRVKSRVRSPDRQTRREWRAHFTWVVDQDQRGPNLNSGGQTHKFEAQKPYFLKSRGAAAPWYTVNPPLHLSLVQSTTTPAPLVATSY
jgi:hypothetical protein